MYDTESYHPFVQRCRVRRVVALPVSWYDPVRPFEVALFFNAVPFNDPGTASGPSGRCVCAYVRERIAFCAAFLVVRMVRWCCQHTSIASDDTADVVERLCWRPTLAVGDRDDWIAAVSARDVLDTATGTSSSTACWLLTTTALL